MPENLNLSLRFEEASESDSEDGAGSIARVFVNSACSYLKDSGAPVISLDCGSVREFEAEIERLRNEIDAISNEARQRFEGLSEATPAKGEASQGAKGRAEEPSLPPLLIPDDVRVRDCMTRDVKTLKPNDKVLVAEELMKVGNFRHMIVVDDEETEVVGVLSHSDICFSALEWSLGEGRTAHDRLLGELPVKQVMQSSVKTVSPDARLTEAAELMAENKISCLPVTEEDRLVGILTAGDFLAMLTGAAYGDEGD